MNIFKDMKQISQEAMGIETPVVPYPGSEIPECHLALDNYDDFVVAAESCSDAFLGAAVTMQEIALESVGLDLDRIGEFNSELSTESITDKVKIAYYSGAIVVKKIVSKIIGFFKTILDALTGMGGRYDSYGKLAEKYAKKLQNAKTSDKAIEKKIKVGNYEGIDAKEIRAFSVIMDKNKVKSVTESLTKLTKEKIAPNELKVVMDGIVILPGKNNSEIYKAVQEQTTKDKDLSKVKEAGEAYLTMIKEKVKFEKEEITVGEAKTKFISYCNKIKTTFSSEMNMKKEYGKLIKLMESKLANVEINPDAKDKAQAAAQAIVKNMNFNLSIMIWIKTMIGKEYKIVTSALQACLADAAKVISAATSINA